MTSFISFKDVNDNPCWVEQFDLVGAVEQTPLNNKLNTTAIYCDAPFVYYANLSLQELLDKMTAQSVTYDLIFGVDSYSGKRGFVVGNALQSARYVAPNMEFYGNTLLTPICLRMTPEEFNVQATVYGDQLF